MESNWGLMGCESTVQWDDNKTVMINGLSAFSAGALGVVYWVHFLLQITLYIYRFSFYSSRGCIYISKEILLYTTTNMPIPSSATDSTRLHLQSLPIPNYSLYPPPRTISTHPHPPSPTFSTYPLISSTLLNPHTDTQKHTPTPSIHLLHHR